MPIRGRGRALRVLLLTSAAACPAAPAAAEVVLDGTLGRAGPLQGPAFEIRAEDGKRVGGNLFHSFRTFDLAHPERATFTGPAGVDNVIGRVTGGERSDIDGTLRSTVPGADLWFLNPAGVVFGPNARLDVRGSLHVSTADELRFVDGARFSATDPAASSFTVAPPKAFGFLSAGPGDLAVDRSRLGVPAGEAISLVGGDITISAGNNGPIGGGEDGVVRAEAGRITLAALAGPGEAHVPSGKVRAEATANIRLSRQALLDVSGDGGGAVRIEGGRFVLAQRSAVAANNLGANEGGGGVTIQAEAVAIGSGSQVTTDVFGPGRGGPLTVRAGEVAVTGGGAIRSRTAAGGDAGTVTVDAGRLRISRDGSAVETGIGSLAGAGSTGAAGAVAVTAADLEVRDGGAIAAATFGAGRGGAVTVEAGRLLISGDGSVALTGITSNATVGSTGDAGAVAVRTDDLEVRDGGEISSSTFAAGAAGPVRVDAGRLRIRRGGSVRFTGVFSAAGVSLAGEGGTGDAGAVAVRTEDLEVRDGGAIAAATQAAGDAGEVLVEAAGRLLVSGDGSPFATGISSRAELGSTGAAGAVKVRAAGRVEVRDGGFIDSLSRGPRDAGAVAVAAPVVHLTDGGAIASSSTGGGKGGDVVVRAMDVFRSTRGAVTAQTAAADAGDIAITAGRLIDLEDSEVTTSAAAGRGSGGNIRIDPEFVVLDDSAIVAQAKEGAGGNIDIVADQLFQTPDSLIDASSRLGIDGQVRVEAPDIDVTSGLVALPAAFVDAAALLRESCGAERSERASSFVGVGRGGVASGPEAPLAGAYAGLIDARTGTAAVADTTPRFEPVALVMACGGED